MSYTISEGSKEQHDAVLKGLIDYNEQKLGTALAPPEKVNRVALDEDGNLIGGILCNYFALMDNMYVDILWVDESQRGKDIGTALLREAEDFARERKCILIWLETFDFQARNFYEKQGYTSFATLEGPPGHERYFMRKYL
jgi:GNAT superfamily N-acetyltransferase